MKCYYCDKLVHGENGLTVPGLGPAHKICFEANQSIRRVFKNLVLTDLNDEELFELKELVIAEENHRNRDASDDIELF